MRNLTNQEEWQNMIVPDEVKQNDSTYTVHLLFDCGSTMTRITEAFPQDNGDVQTSECHGMSSAYVVTDENFVSDKHKRNRVLYDNIFAKITRGDDTNVNDKNNSILPRVSYILKGKLAEEEAEKVETAVMSSTRKADMPQTYINILVGTAMHIISQMNPAKNEYAKVYNLVPSILLPPSEMVNKEQDQRKIRENLKGTHTVELRELGIKIKIFVDDNDLYEDRTRENAFHGVKFLPEPVAAMLGVIYNDDFDADIENVIGIDAGGKSSDIALMFENKILDQDLETLDRGGLTMMKTLSAKIKAEHQIAVNQDKLEEALTTGIYKINSRKSEDISTLIEEEKIELADILAKQVLRNLGEKTIANFDTVIYHGRLFNPTMRPNGAGTICLGDLVTEELKNSNEKADFEAITCPDDGTNLVGFAIQRYCE